MAVPDLCQELVPLLENCKLIAVNVGEDGGTQRALVYIATADTRFCVFDFRLATGSPSARIEQFKRFLRPGPSRGVQTHWILIGLDCLGDKLYHFLRDLALLVPYQPDLQVIAAISPTVPRTPSGWRRLPFVVADQTGIAELARAHGFRIGVNASADIRELVGASPVLIDHLICLAAEDISPGGRIEQEHVQLARQKLLAEAERPPVSWWKQIITDHRELWPDLELLTAPPYRFVVPLDRVAEALECGLLARYPDNTVLFSCKLALELFLRYRHHSSVLKLQTRSGWQVIRHDELADCAKRFDLLVYDRGQAYVRGRKIIERKDVKFIVVQALVEHALDFADAVVSHQELYERSRPGRSSDDVEQTIRQDIVALRRTHSALRDLVVTSRGQGYAIKPEAKIALVRTRDNTFYAH